MKERRIAVIGSGGREHALALRLLQSESVAEVSVCPGNPGTATAPAALAQQGKRLRNVAADALDWIDADAADLVVVGPEAPLCAGWSDRLTERGVTVFGPSMSAARLEGSKAFMKEFAARHWIRTARHRVVRELAELDAALAEFDAAPVVKADGLCGGKGVVVAEDLGQAREAARNMLSGARFGAAGRTLVLEERVHGFEASVHAICDGERCWMLPSAQDHKRLGAGDTGPNTGGMGTFAPSPRLGAALLEKIRVEIIERAVQGMRADGHPFRGALFAGLMIDEAGEPSLLEFNVRFGDPETQVLMPLIQGDLAEALAAAARGEWSDDLLSVRSAHAVCIVLAAAGYPDGPRTGDPIEGLEQLLTLPEVNVYHAGTQKEAGRLVTAGGRVLGVTACAAKLEQARRLAYQATGMIHFEGMQWRDDIGTQLDG